MSNDRFPDLVADELEIRALVHRYADASSRRDPRGVASTFTAQGEWLAELLGQHRGHEALVEFFSTMLDGWNAFVQGLLSGVVVLGASEADCATGRWFVQETGQRGDGSNLSVAGVYHDEYARGPHGWRISRRRYDPLLVRMDDAVTAMPFPADVPVSALPTAR